uniref:Uncharacterized protein n=1 Tax=Hippocampus comes TaxID=109280 RepID=A0A3Q2YWS8_HIPCM
DATAQLALVDLLLLRFLLQAREQHCEYCTRRQHPFFWFLPKSLCGMTFPDEPKMLNDPKRSTSIVLAPTSGCTVELHSSPTENAFPARMSE